MPKTDLYVHEVRRSAVPDKLWHNEVILTNYASWILLMAAYAIANVVLFLHGFEDTFAPPMSPSLGYPNTVAVKAVFSLSRGFGWMINLNSALIFIPMLRFFANFLQRTWVGMIFPFHQMLLWHRIIGTVLGMASLGHGVIRFAAFMLQRNDNNFWSSGATGTISVCCVVPS